MKLTDTMSMRGVWMPSRNALFSSLLFQHIYNLFRKPEARLSDFLPHRIRHDEFRA